MDEGNISIEPFAGQKVVFVLLDHLGQGRSSRTFSTEKHIRLSN
jgi:hypothetical protein